MTWVKKWQVESFTSDNVYVVGLSETGSFGCSCPAWTKGKYSREDCKHIKKIQDEQRRGLTEKYRTFDKAPIDPRVQAATGRPERLQQPSTVEIGGRVKRLITLPD